MYDPATGRVTWDRPNPKNYSGQVLVEGSLNVRLCLPSLCASTRGEADSSPLCVCVCVCVHTAIDCAHRMEGRSCPLLWRPHLPRLEGALISRRLEDGSHHSRQAYLSRSRVCLVSSHVVVSCRAGEGGGNPELQRVQIRVGRAVGGDLPSTHLMAPKH